MNNPNLGMPIVKGEQTPFSQPSDEKTQEQPKNEIIPGEGEVRQEKIPVQPQPMVIEEPPREISENNSSVKTIVETPTAPSSSNIREQDLTGSMVDIKEAERLQNELISSNQA